MNNEAYKLASSFYLSSVHDDWSGERIRKAILADIDGEDAEALADQDKLEVWYPIDRYLETSHPMGNQNEALDELIENLADAFVQFARCVDVAPHAYERVAINP